MRKILITSYLLSLFLLSSCNKKSQSNTFSFNGIEKESAKMDFEQLAYQVDYIALETTDESFIPDIWDLKFDDDYIFVLSANKGVFQFGMDGKFLKKIAQMGGAPQEHNILYTFDIDSDNKKVYLYDISGKLLVFNYDGEYITHYNLERLDFPKLYVVNNTEIAFLAYNNTGEESPIICKYSLLDTTCNKLGQLSSFVLEKADNMMYMLTKGIFEFGNNEIIVHPNFSNTVYSFSSDSNTLTKRYEFEFDEPFFPELMGEGFGALPKAQALLDISEDSYNIFASIIDRSMNPSLYVIDKESETSYIADLRYSNDFKTSFRPKYQSKNMLADIILDFYSLNYSQGETPSEKEIQSAIDFFSQKTGVSISFESNPIVVIIKK